MGSRSRCKLGIHRIITSNRSMTLHILSTASVPYLPNIGTPLGVPFLPADVPFVQRIPCSVPGSCILPTIFYIAHVCAPSSSKLDTPRRRHATSFTANLGHIPSASTIHTFWVPHLLQRPSHCNSLLLFLETVNSRTQITPLFLVTVITYITTSSLTTRHVLTSVRLILRLHSIVFILLSRSSLRDPRVLLARTSSCIIAVHLPFHPSSSFSFLYHRVRRDPRQPLPRTVPSKVLIANRLAISVTDSPSRAANQARFPRAPPRKLGL